MDDLMPSPLFDLFDLKALFAGLPTLDSTATDEASFQFLFGLLQKHRPQSIIEAGTYQGHFAVGAARLLPHTFVITFDPIDHGWTKNLVPNMQFLRHDFNFIPTAFDFAFIDSGPPFPGSPTPQQPAWEHDIRWRHWRLACDAVLPGGFVACHDTNATDWQHAKEIRAQCQMHFAGGRGVSVWEKPR